MFRDTSLVESISDLSGTTWAVAGSTPKLARAAPPGEDEVGAVWHIYQEIGRRIASNAYTRHASTLGNAER